MYLYVEVKRKSYTESYCLPFFVLKAILGREEFISTNFYCIHALFIGIRLLTSGLGYRLCTSG